MMNEFSKHYIELTSGKIEYDVYLNKTHILMEQEQ